MRPAPTVTLTDGPMILWTGTLRAFLLDNDMDRNAARTICRQLRRYGNATVGGGATGDFTLKLAGRR